jgi:hypothetical protein
MKARGRDILRHLLKLHKTYYVNNGAIMDDERLDRPPMGLERIGLRGLRHMRR